MVKLAISMIIMYGTPQKGEESNLKNTRKKINLYPKFLNAHKA
jgi:hypothetical protein